jgi:hypothetical protein
MVLIDSGTAAITFIQHHLFAVMGPAFGIGTGPQQLAHF